MHHFDTEYAAEVIQRLKGIPEDAKPDWGSMTKSMMIEHVLFVMRQSMGMTPFPDVGNWFTHKVLKPLILRGLIKIPKNAQLPKKYRDQGYMLRESGDLETLKSVFEEYLALVQAGELKPARHPVFGDLGVDGWSVMHVRHLEHHLKQFGA